MCLRAAEGNVLQKLSLVLVNEEQPRCLSQYYKVSAQSLLETRKVRRKSGRGNTSALRATW